MNIPKEMVICGKPHRVILDKNKGGGWFDEARCEVGIGTKYPKEVPEILLHEVIESVFAIRNLRYVRERAETDNGDYAFIFNHELFEQAIKDIAFSLKGIKF